MNRHIYDFDTIYDRVPTYAKKWHPSYLEPIFGSGDVLPLWIADMDFAAPPEVVAALRERMAHPVFGYTMRSPAFFESVAAWTERRYRWKIHPDWIVPCPGVVPGIALAIRAFTLPGEGVVIQSPVYPPFFESINKNSRVTTVNRLVEKNGTWEMDLDDLERCLGENTSLLLSCSPHNPVGRVWKRAELEAVAERALRSGTLLVSDEIHADIVFRGHAHIPLASLAPEVAARTVTLLAPSKTFNIAGLQTSLAIIPDPDLRRTFRNELESLHLEGGNLFGMLALEIAYGQGEPWLEALLAYLEDNLDLLGNFLRDRLPSVGYIRPEGTYVAWLDFRSLGLAPEELQRFLVHEARLALNAGTSFGPGGEGFARLNFGCPRTLLSEGLTRLADAVSRLEGRGCCSTEA